MLNALHKSETCDAHDTMLSDGTDALIEQVSQVGAKIKLSAEEVKDS